MNTQNEILEIPYLHPPVVEALIALHFSNELSFNFIKDFAKEIQVKFPKQKTMSNINISVDFQTDISAPQTNKQGMRLFNKENDRIITLLPNQINVSHLPPYKGWDVLHDDFNTQMSILLNIAQNLCVSYPSARYLNRIDIPNSNGNIDLNTYFKVGLFLPESVSDFALENFNLSCSLLDKNGEYRFILNLTPIPIQLNLIGHSSFMIDIECSPVLKKQLNKDEIWNLVDSLRNRKNEFFEACITDETRKLFK